MLGQSGVFVKGPLGMCLSYWLSDNLNSSHLCDLGKVSG